jgi:hypothetical protein
MKDLDEVTMVVLSVFFIVIVLGGALTYSEQQQRALFQQTYDKNMECRQSIKDQSVEKIADICGPIPVVGDYVND